MSATPSRLSNYAVEVPGSTVTACLGVRHERDPGHWIYTLWYDFGSDDQELLAQGSFDLDDLAVTPEQVARIAFLLEVDYGEDAADLMAGAGEMEAGA